MRVLAIMTHPDDIELYCAGTLLKYKQRGDFVVGCHVANGNMGHVEIMPDELREIRDKESENSAKIGGFDILSLDVGDLTVDSTNIEQLEKVTKLIRDVKPDVIITQSPTDYCSDHVEVSKLVFKASFDASVPHFKPHLGKACDVMPVYYAENDYGMDFMPTEYVDITDVMETKEKMLACHESQLVWIKDHDGVDLIDWLRMHSEERGSQCSVKYAEGFVPMIRSQRMRTYRVLP